MDDRQADRAQAQLRAGVYTRLSETYDAAESVSTQIERGADHATRRGWTVAATFKDDGYSGFKKITRDRFGELIAAIEAATVDVVIVRERSLTNPYHLPGEAPRCLLSCHARHPRELILFVSGLLAAHRC